MPKKSIPVKERFIKLIKSVNNCWEWQGSLDAYGYGQIYDGIKRVKVHRFSWELFNGKIPENMCVCHHCDNRKCVNPNHLFIGTQQDNLKDMNNKKRNIIHKRPDLFKPRYGENSPNYKLSDLTVKNILNEYNEGYSQYKIAEKYNISQSYVSRLVNKINRHFG